MVTCVFTFLREKPRFKIKEDLAFLPFSHPSFKYMCQALTTHLILCWVLGLEDSLGTSGWSWDQEEEEEEEEEKKEEEEEEEEEVSWWLRDGGIMWKCIASTREHGASQVWRDQCRAGSLGMLGREVGAGVRQRAGQPSRWTRAWSLQGFE